MTDVELDEINLRINKYKFDSPSLLKFKTKVEFDSIGTNIICIEYADKLFISISSSGKFGAVIFAKAEKSEGVNEDTIFTVKNLFGQFESLLQVFVRSLAEKILTTLNINKPLLVSIGVTKEQLKNTNLFKDYENRILENLVKTSK